MALSALFVPMMAYVQSIERQHNPAAQVVHDELQALIISAQEQAIIRDIPHDRFHDALFPVVAWGDERLANLPAWRESRDWRAFMFQRKLYQTTLAGVAFYDRLKAVPEDDHELREIFILCLCMKFLGRFAQTPNDPALIELRLKNYKLLRPHGTFTDGEGVAQMFPEAYRVASSDERVKKRKNQRQRYWLFAVALPLVGLIALAFAFNYDLTLKINEITQMLNS